MKNIKKVAAIIATLAMLGFSLNAVAQLPAPEDNLPTPVEAGIEYHP